METKKRMFKVPPKLQKAVRQAEKKDVPMSTVIHISKTCSTKAAKQGGTASDKVQLHTACTITGIKAEIEKQKKKFYE